MSNDKIREALERYARTKWPKTTDGAPCRDELIAKDALAALSELEAQPQPANEGAEPVECGCGDEIKPNTDAICGNCAAKYTSPQPAKALTEADVIAWLEEKRMMWKGLGVSTRNVKDHELIPIPELLLRYARDNGYLAPAQPPAPTVEQIMDVILDEFSALNPKGGVAQCLRHRLTKLMQP